MTEKVHKNLFKHRACDVWSIGQGEECGEDLPVFTCSSFGADTLVEEAITWPTSIEIQK